MELGIDHTGTWTAHQYVIDAGWDPHCVEQTAKLGIAPADGALLPDQQSKLLAFCRDRFPQQRRTRSYYAVDLYQGNTEHDVPFGYVHSGRETGWFFEYPHGRALSSLADVRTVVSTLAADEIDTPERPSSIAKARVSLFRRLRKTIR